MYVSYKNTSFEEKWLLLNLSVTVAIQVMCDYHQLFWLAKPVVLSLKIGWILSRCGGGTHVT